MKTLNNEVCGLFWVAETVLICLFVNEKFTLVLQCACISSMNDKQEQFDDNLMMTNNDLKPVAAGRNHFKSVFGKIIYLKYRQCIIKRLKCVLKLYYGSFNCFLWNTIRHSCCPGGNETLSLLHCSKQLASLVSTAALTLDDGSRRASLESLGFQVLMFLWNTHFTDWPHTAQINAGSTNHSYVPNPVDAQSDPASWHSQGCKTLTSPLCLSLSPPSHLNLTPPHPPGKSQSHLKLTPVNLWEVPAAMQSSVYKKRRPFTNSFPDSTLCSPITARCVFLPWEPTCMHSFR